MPAGDGHVGPVFKHLTDWAAEAGWVDPDPGPPVELSADQRSAIAGSDGWDGDGRLIPRGAG